MSQSVLYVVAYAVVNQQQLLTVRKKDTQKFMFPGGKFKSGENAEAAIRREIQEELSCNIDCRTFKLLGKFTTAAANEANTQLIATVFQGDLMGTPVASSEIAEIKWISIMAKDYAIELAPLVADCVLPHLRRLYGKGVGP
ncbi:MAG: NUDIX domain-containing protein [Symploca sp. SIO2G7]|nr:NUDIX domain-containing protein [Symploca sp. SIO2G7]